MPHSAPVDDEDNKFISDTYIEQQIEEAREQIPVNKPKNRLIFVPSTGSRKFKTIEEEPYFHGFLKREEAVKMLTDRLISTFLVRRIAFDDGLHDVISVVGEGYILHHCIIRRTNTKKLYFADTYAFLTVRDLVMFHMNNNIPIRVWTDQDEDLPAYKAQTKLNNEMIKKYKKRKLKYGNSEPEPKTINLRDQRTETIAKRGFRLVLLKHPLMKSKNQIYHDQLELTVKLGEGQFGQVYRGFFETSFKDKKTLVAVKKLHDRDFSPKDRISMLTEAEVQKGLDFKHVVKMYGIAATRDPIMIVLEYCDGQSLDKTLEEFVTNIQQKLHYLYCAARGLAYLHLHGVLHRDIAARNCLVDRCHNLKISDFGLSAVDATGQGLLEKKGGNAPVKYMSPETLRSGVYNARTDVYSFAVLMFEVFHSAQVPLGQFNLPPVDLRKAIIYQYILLKLWDETEDKVTNPRGIKITDDLLVAGEVLKKDHRAFKRHFPITPQADWDYRTEKPENEELANDLETLFERCHMYRPSGRPVFVKDTGDELQEPIADTLHRMMSKIKMWREEDDCYMIVVNEEKFIFARALLKRREEEETLANKNKKKKRFFFF